LHNTIKIKILNTEYFIANRLIKDKEQSRNISRPIITIAISGIALGLAIMIVAVAIVTGFKNEIRNKVIGFGSHIQIINYDTKSSFETIPIKKNQDFYPDIKNDDGIKQIQVFATKPGIIKTDTDIQGVVLKGIGSDFDWSFFKKNLVDGNTFNITDSLRTNKALISKYIASLLKLKTGDDFIMYFVQDPPRMRRFFVEGIYNTSLEALDKLFILVDISHIQRLNGWTENEITGFEILIDYYKNIEYMTDYVRDIAGYQFDEDGALLKTININEKYPQYFEWLELQDTNVWVILILMLVVAVFNMISGLLILILERTNMIGILKAIGTENWSIRKIFLYQSSYLIAKGLFWGNLIGISLCLVQFHFGIIKLDPSSYWVPVVPINLRILPIILLNLGTLLITFLMLIIPSAIISKISPVKTIRFN